MRSEQAALIRKAQDSLEASRLLAEQGYFDFSISRSYYTMFYIAEAMLLGEGLTFSKHSAVIAAFGQRFSKLGRVAKDFHRYLIEGFDRRNTGDYDIKPGFSEDEAKEQIKRADEFLEMVENFLS